MYQHYLVTGATGFLGRTLVSEMDRRGMNVSALVMKSDPFVAGLPDGVSVFYGDVSDKASMRPFFESGGENFCVIHCAGIISIASAHDERIYRVNVGGTRNVAELCEAYHASKLIYVSSVHAIPELSSGDIITEPKRFSPSAVWGDYAKSKASATQIVLEFARRGLNASVVLPSGIIGPGDTARGNITEMLLAFCKGRLPFGVRGGYDFADVRDVADGILSCAEKGRIGECYILSGHYSSIRNLLASAGSVIGRAKPPLCVPIGIARAVAPFSETISRIRKKKPFFTPYSIAVLASNGRFSHRKASCEFGYEPRSLDETLRDTVLWLSQFFDKNGATPFCGRRPGMTCSNLQNP